MQCRLEHLIKGFDNNSQATYNNISVISLYLTLVSACHQILCHMHLIHISHMLTFLAYAYVNDSVFEAYVQRQARTWGNNNPFEPVKGRKPTQIRTSIAPQVGLLARTFEMHPGHAGSFGPQRTYIGIGLSCPDTYQKQREKRREMLSNRKSSKNRPCRPKIGRLIEITSFWIFLSLITPLGRGDKHLLSI